MVTIVLRLFAFDFLPPVTQPERSGRRAKKAEKCLRERSERVFFRPPDDRSAQGTRRRRARSRGAFFCLLFFGVKKE
jgi:hypothetical protein